MPLTSRVSEKMRSSCGAMRMNACASLVVLNGPPAIVVSTTRIAGICFNSASMARIASSIAATLAPSGAATLISNDASSTPDGRKSWRTTRYSGTMVAITVMPITATIARRRSARASVDEYTRSITP